MTNTPAEANAWQQQITRACFFPIATADCVLTNTASLTVELTLVAPENLPQKHFFSI